MAERPPCPAAESKEPLLPHQQSGKKTGIIAEGTEAAESGTNFGSYFYWSHFLIGLTILTPWNVLVGAVDYFKEVYPKYDAVRWVTLSLVISEMISCAILAFIPPKNRGHGRITFGYAAFALFMAFLATTDLIFNQGSEGKDGMFILVVVIAALNGFFVGFVEGSVGGVVSYAPTHIYKVYVRGIGISPVLFGAVRMILKASFTETVNSLRYSACGFFIFTSISCLVCLVAHRRYIVSNPIYDKAFQAVDQNQGHGSGSRDPGFNRGRSVFRTWVEVAKMIRYGCLSLFLTFMATLAIFPGIPADAHSRLLGSWYEVLLVFVANSADLTTRFVPGHWIETRPERVILYNAIRILFLPVLFVIVKLFSNLVTIPAILVLNGGAQGYFTICGYAMVQKELHGSKESFIGGNIAVLALVAGCSAGSGTSVLWSYLMNHL